jgi:hypothetical protein
MHGPEQQYEAGARRSEKRSWDLLFTYGSAPTQAKHIVRLSACAFRPGAGGDGHTSVAPQEIASEDKMNRKVLYPKTHEETVELKKKYARTRGI